jgi:hypothetical protein
LIAATLLLAVTASLLPHAALAKKPRNSDAIWKEYLADWEELLETLAPAFVSCFQRRDSLIDPLAPIFHGCIDWHSAVHSAYSHHVLYRRTGEGEYLDLVQAQIAPQGVSLVPAEEVYEQAKAPDYPLTENPYGFGWFLLLARERELAAEMKDLREMAAFAVEQLVSWFQARAAEGDATGYILDRRHPNYSFSLINLSEWAQYTEDEALLEVTREAAEPLLDPGLDVACPVTLDKVPTATGFQPACLMRLAAVAHVLGEEAGAWVEKRMPKRFHVRPVTEPRDCHAGGLNFTRAFALYQIYLVTGDSKYRDNYVELIRYHVGRPDLYLGEMYLGNPDYLCYSHWVAQVGVRAISVSY